MPDAWGWCLIFVLHGQQPIVQFDLKTETECEAVRASVTAPGAQSWCVPIIRNETKSSKKKWKVVE